MKPEVIPLAMWSLSRGVETTGIRMQQDKSCWLPAAKAIIKLINIQQVNEAFERLERGDVKYRFVIDMASLTN